MTFFRRFAKNILIIINVFFGILFLQGSYVIYFDPNKWWFFGLLTLSLPYILVILIILLFVWAVMRKIWFLISLMAIGLCWYPVQHIIPFNLSSEFNLRKEPGTMRIMDWNTEHFDILEHKNHPEIKQKMLDLINEYQPDIACFQEVVGSENPKAINYIPDILQRLQFSNHYYSYDPRWNFDDDHHYGIMIVSRYPIINRQTIIEYPYDYNSIFQYVDVLVGNDTIRIMNMHLQTLRFTGSNLEYLNNPSIGSDSGIVKSRNIISKLKTGFKKRSVQADRVKSEIDKSSYPVIVCGDFNDVPNSYAYATIGRNMQNAFVEKGRGMGRTFAGIAPTLRIDNIFADKRFEITQFARRPEKLVAHFPIIADMKLKP